MTAPSSASVPLVVRLPQRWAHGIKRLARQDAARSVSDIVSQAIHLRCATQLGQMPIARLHGAAASARPRTTSHSAARPVQLKCYVPAALAAAARQTATSSGCSLGQLILSGIDTLLMIQGASWPERGCQTARRGRPPAVPSSSHDNLPVVVLDD